MSGYIHICAVKTRNLVWRRKVSPVDLCVKPDCIQFSGEVRQGNFTGSPFSFRLFHASRGTRVETSPARMFLWGDGSVPRAPLHVSGVRNEGVRDSVECGYSTAGTALGRLPPIKNKS